MSFRRVLVGCAVLSLQDACVFYPCCKACFSRLDAEQRGATRYRCSRCGYWCLKDQVDYRYRLSLRVVREAATFGVTVFGSTLNSYFGTPATGLQRLVENLEAPVGASAISTLLVKAVEDCFLGRHFIFGIKVNGAERQPWLNDPDGNDLSRSERAQFVATQMILPTASGLTGCTVLSYYQRLLQKADSSDPNRTFRSLPAPLLLISGPSPSSTFNDVTLYPSGLLSHSLLRPQHQDHTLALTPPWQQSLGLVTSSAEQEEQSSQDGGDQTSRPTAKLHPVQRVYTDNRPWTEERTVPIQLGCSFHSSPFSARHSNSPFRHVVGNGVSGKTSFSPSQPRQKSCSLTPQELSTTPQTKSCLSSSFAWDDLPFSESLTDFLCEQDKDVNVFNKTTNVNLQHQKQTSRNFVETVNPSAEPVFWSSGEKISIDKLQVMTNGPDGGTENMFSYQDSEICAERINRCKHRRIPGGEEAHLSFEQQVEHNEEDGYNCSADLFSDSLIIGEHTNTHTPHSQTVRSPSRAGAEMNVQHLKNENLTMSQRTPHKQRLKCKINSKRDSLCPQDLDFVPPSQSTPVGAVTQSLANTSTRNFKDESSKEHFMSRARSSRITLRMRLRKQEKNTDRHPVGQHATPQRETLNFKSPRRTSPKHDSKASNMTDCDYEEAEGIVAPTPAHKMQSCAALRKRWQMENNRRDLDFYRKRSGGDGVDCIRLLRDQTRTVLHANETVSGRHGDGSEDHLYEDGNYICDWSRDLFSDSI